ncbi:hypothetical protein F5Y18DRAFT_209906 [Xylariaceae sp. FL1019]|nr:hypothetical protein F5Y18DRAFT_209906 [Xylariaceae sp. FL1019]
MPSHSYQSSTSFSDGFSASTRPNSDSEVPGLEPDLSSTEDLTSDYLSTRTRSVLGPIIDPDDYGSNPYGGTSIYAGSHYPALSITHQSVDRSWEDAETFDSTRSITDRDVNYVTENGRRYCGSYYMPNDEDEQVRLQLLNQVYLKVFDGELTTVPLECPTHILDVGTAAGEWAIDMAEAYPECDITGTDISNIFERRVPQNVYWEIDDAEVDWERPSDHYDLVHLRDMTGAFSDWEAIYKSAFRCLKPGGWIEVLDFDDKKGMADLFAYFEPESMLYKLVRDLMDASIMSGKPRGIGHLEPRLLVNAGYVDVKLTEYSIPLKTADGSTGKFWLLSCLNGIEPTCMRLLTKYKGWTPDEVRMGCEMVGEELMTLAQDRKLARNFVTTLRVLTGRKPGCWSKRPFTSSLDDIMEDGTQLNTEQLELPEDTKSKLAIDLASRTAQEQPMTGPQSEIQTTERPNTTEAWVRNVVPLDYQTDDRRLVDAMEAGTDADTEADEDDDTMMDDKSEIAGSVDESNPSTTKGRPMSIGPAVISQIARPIPDHSTSKTNRTRTFTL